MNSGNDNKLEIEYPCKWDYKIIGGSQDLVREAVVEVIGDVDHTLDISNISNTGKYCSLRLEITVVGDEHRTSVYKALAAHPSIKMVL